MTIGIDLATAGPMLLAWSIADVFIIGSEFLPTIDEGNFLLRATMPASISLSRATEISSQIEKTLRGFPEVETVVAKIGRAELGGAPQRREVLTSGAVGLRENDIRVGELFVGRHELPRIDELGASESVEIGGDDGRGQPFAEAGGDVERGGWTVTEEAYAVEGVVQLAELSVDERTRPPSLAATQEGVDC